MATRPLRLWIVLFVFSFNKLKIGFLFFKVYLRFLGNQRERFNSLKEKVNRKFSRCLTVFINYHWVWILHRNDLLSVELDDMANSSFNDQSPFAAIWHLLENITKSKTSKLIALQLSVPKYNQIDLAGVIKNTISRHILCISTMNWELVQLSRENQTIANIYRSII